MKSDTVPPSAFAWAIARIVVGAAVIGVLGYGYTLRLEAGDGNPFDYFGYFTNQTSLLAALLLVVTGAVVVAGRGVSRALILLRGIVTAYLIVVAVVYNVLVPGTGSAPPWMSALLHAIFPVLFALDWLLSRDRARLPWSRLWLLLPYPILWLAVVLMRGATDGWVPYGFLLPERGITSLLLHIAGLLAAILAAGALVWAASRLRGARTDAVAPTVHASTGGHAPEFPIRTARLLLRPIVLADAEAMHAYKSDPDAVRYVPYEPLTLADVERRIATTWANTQFAQEGDAVSLAVEDRETGALLGDVVLFWRGETDRAGEVGYIFDPRVGGRGYATEAVAALLALGFDGLGLLRIVARIDDRNTSSARVAERLGFRREARLVESEWFKGEWTTLLVYALLEDEWRLGSGATA
ncbi:GNAT family N-acetyltransferase [Microbacterium oxydans]|uniref:GNAT family N-acetyltransferase n=1 Tax=Microbacterium oxydans TaxID=82380 RepID=UPI00226B46B9|nr:GNAT family N-acetyltransferase [Microbacterium oxydans]WAA66117.1 GNAT family N-acetyltransferase [Microbacterium oxydans]